MISERTIWWTLSIVGLSLVVFWAVALSYYFIRKRSQPPAHERLVDFLKTRRSLLTHAQIDVDLYLTMIEEKGALVAVTTILEQTESLPPGYWKFLLEVKDELERKA